MFINPMWDNESQRVGMQKCTPLGYALSGVSDLIGFVALLVLICAGIYLAYRAVIGTFDVALWWFLAAPLDLVLVRIVLARYSWVLAAKKQFHYDYETRTASWLKDGRQCTYKFQPER